jgi:hypothetical protein
MILGGEERPKAGNTIKGSGVGSKTDVTIK